MVLTHNEAVVLDIVRTWSQNGQPVAAWVIKDLAHTRSSVRYDAVDYALRRLMENGTVERVSRGFYRATGD